MSVSERILKRREQLGFSQTELAKRAGLKPPAISQYESGLRSPSYEALIKLSNALNVTTDFLISGDEVRTDNINDKTSKILLKIIQNLPISKKDKLLEYAIFLSSEYHENEMPILNETEYANYVIKNYSGNNLPIDVYDIAEKLNISIYEDNLNGKGEGILVKGQKKIIILNNQIKNQQRKKFTLAILIGHSIIPWHVQPTYTVRKEGKSTLLVEDMQEIEAQTFAANLLMPRINLQKDFAQTKVNIQELKDLALNKYDVSLFSFLNCLVDYSKDKYAVAQSDSWDVIKTFQGNRPLVDKVHPNSVTATFIDNPSETEEIRRGQIPAEYWLNDAKIGEIINEEAIYNPEYKKVLTLLTVSK